MIYEPFHFGEDPRRISDRLPLKIRLRNWLICKLAGNRAIVLNVSVAGVIAVHRGDEVLMCDVNIDGLGARFGVMVDNYGKDGAPYAARREIDLAWSSGRLAEIMARRGGLPNG
jgi:hypothetical protein